MSVAAASSSALLITGTGAGALHGDARSARVLVIRSPPTSSHSVSPSASRYGLSSFSTVANTGAGAPNGSAGVVRVATHTSNAPPPPARLELKYSSRRSSDRCAPHSVAVLLTFAISCGAPNGPVHGGGPSIGPSSAAPSSGPGTSPPAGPSPSSAPKPSRPHPAPSVAATTSPADHTSAGSHIRT